MIYVLIFVWKASFGSAPVTSTVAEFNGVEACRTAAAEIRRQADATGSDRVQLLLCAAKGAR